MLHDVIQYEVHSSHYEASFPRNMDLNLITPLALVKSTQETQGIEQSFNNTTRTQSAKSRVQNILLDR